MPLSSLNLLLARILFVTYERTILLFECLIDLVGGDKGGSLCMLL